MSTEAEGVVIDTSCWIEAMRSRGDAAVRARVDRLVDTGRARLAEIVRLELWNGLSGASQRRFLRAVESALETVPTTSEAWGEARRVADLARREGVTVPVADLIVFATARVHGLELFHFDSHFDALETLVSE